MMVNAGWLIVAALVVVASQTTSAPRGGLVPAGIGTAMHVEWLSLDATESDTTCVLEPALRWTCRGVAPSSRGLVVITAEHGVVAIPIGNVDGGAGELVSRWGRLLQILPGAVATDDLVDLGVAAWRPERPNARQQSRRLVPIADSAVAILQITATSFWVAGTADSDGFIEVSGPRVATMRMPTASLASGSLDRRVPVAASPPYAVLGRVESRNGAGVDDVEVELFEPLDHVDAADTNWATRDLTLIRRAQTVSAGGGTFTFMGMSPGRYRVFATHATEGRGDLAIERLGEPAVITLAAPMRARGRVLRRGLPVADARVRFMPDTAAWMGSADPRALISEEAASAADGRFVVSIPSRASGWLQILAGGGASVRVAVAATSGAAEVDVGDVTIPEPRRVTLRVIDTIACDLSAIGPLGQLGLNRVRGTPAGGNVFWFEFPEPGRWALSASCDGKDYVVNPLIVSVAADGPESTVDVRVGR